MRTRKNANPALKMALPMATKTVCVKASGMNCAMTITLIPAMVRVAKVAAVRMISYLVFIFVSLFIYILECM
jgi:hypothetical protein